MKNINISRNKNTVSATYLPYAAYKSAIALATALKGKIDKTAEGNFKATFNSVKTAEKFKAQWTDEYNANRKAEPTTAPKRTPAPTKGKANLVTVTVDGVSVSASVNDWANANAANTDEKVAALATAIAAYSVVLNAYFAPAA